MSIMTMHTLIRMFPGERFRDPAAVVGEVNDRLCENSIVQSGGRRSRIAPTKSAMAPTHASECS